MAENLESRLTIDFDQQFRSVAVASDEFGKRESFVGTNLPRMILAIMRDNRDSRIERKPNNTIWIGTLR